MITRLQGEIDAESRDKWQYGESTSDSRHEGWSPRDDELLEIN